MKQRGGRSPNETSAFHRQNQSFYTFVQLYITSKTTFQWLTQNKTVRFHLLYLLSHFIRPTPLYFDAKLYFISIFLYSNVNNFTGTPENSNFSNFRNSYNFFFFCFQRYWTSKRKRIRTMIWIYMLNPPTIYMTSRQMKELLRRTTKKDTKSTFFFLFFFSRTFSDYRPQSSVMSFRFISYRLSL